MYKKIQEDKPSVTT